MSDKPEPQRTPNTPPSEAGHDRNINHNDKGLAERSVNEPHPEQADDNPPAPKNS